jgi:DHA3 family tetracycline resistance protein-like MFS transporter
MLWLTGLMALAIFVYAYSPLLAISIGALLMVSVTRNVIGPLYNAWVNQRLDPDVRATVISMSGQVDAIGQIASGPLAGLVSLWSVQAAIAFASFLLTPALPLIRRANRLHAISQAGQIEK